MHGFSRFAGNELSGETMTRWNVRSQKSATARLESGMDRGRAASQDNHHEKDLLQVPVFRVCV
jgi:hypothetical protein